jgi:hypothetical protein
MAELTKDKLNEARFLLSKLLQQQAEQAQPHKPPSEEFRYYLSAFASAARSVTWVLQSEEREKYDAWSSSWDAQRLEEYHALLELTNDMRNSAVKRGRIETVSRSEEVAIPLNPDPYQIHALRAYALSLRQGGGPRTHRDMHYVELEGKEQEIVIVCQRYVEFLTSLVQDFVDKHPE